MNQPLLSRTTALLTVGGVLLASAAVSQHYSPDPRHPKIFRWYRSLRQPAIKPPDLVFGAVWPVVETAISAGAYRLMRRPRSAEGEQAIALWAATIALVTGYSAVFFGRRDLTHSVAEAAALVAVAAAYVERARHADRGAAWAGVPLTLWSAFGTLLTERVREKNPDLDHGA